VFASFADLMDQRVLWQSTIATGRSWAAAFAIAAILGVALGLVTGSGRTLGALLSPTALVFGAFPLPALAAVLVLWMGLGTAAAGIAAGALLALFPIAAIVARSRPSPDAGLRLKGVFHAFEIGVVLSLFGVLFTEMLAGRGRLGSMVIELQSNFETKRLLALVFYLWLLGLAAMLPFTFCRWISGFGR
jgi:ABC-type nitrate/sulfonate/bicarbonate transport system permease component